MLLGMLWSFFKAFEGCVDAFEGGCCWVEVNMLEEVRCFLELFTYAGFIELGGEDNDRSPFVRWFY